MGEYHKKQGDYNFTEPFYRQNQNSSKDMVMDSFTIYQTFNDWLLKERENIHCFPISVDQNSSIECPLDFATFAELAAISRPLIETVKIYSDSLIEMDEVFNTMFVNENNRLIRLSINKRIFLIPAHSQFMISDFQLVPRYLKMLKTTFDIILMDPPWSNKSVSRSNNYKSLDKYCLYDIPIQKIIKKGGFVCIWVTNNDKIHNFVLKKLFPSWNLSLYMVVVWLKVTTQGEPVVPLNSSHRKPVEFLYIARYTETVTEISKRLIVSIPGKHSRKPFLDNIIGDLMEPNSVKLELFARSVQSGWNCWGNEACFFNYEGYWVV